MDKARIKVRPALGVVLAAKVPKGFNPVRVIKVTVHAEDVTEAHADVIGKGLREPSSLADPIAAG